MTDDQMNSEHSQGSAELAYQTATQLLIHEGSLVWNRFSVFLVANSVVIAAMGVLLRADAGAVLFSACFLALGLCSCVFWYLLTVRGFHRCGHYHEILVGLEKECLGDTLLVLRLKESSGEFWPRIAKWKVAQPHWIALFHVSVFVVLYLVLFVAAMYR